MKGLELGSKYLVERGKMDQTVMPAEFAAAFALRFPPGLSSVFSCGALQGKIAAEPPGATLMPRCFSYQAYSRAGSSDLKKIPPMPVARFMCISLRSFCTEVSLI